MTTRAGRIRINKNELLFNFVMNKTNILMINKHKTEFFSLKNQKN